MPSLFPWVHLWAPVPSQHSLRVPLVLLVCTYLIQDILPGLIQRAEGGKTGITAIVTGLLFFVSIFFAPIFASIPPWATGGALVIVGSLMIRNVRDINWDYVGDAVPAFLTILFIPLSYK
jgi:MFS superfamily sulfate permease-like transporter